MAKYIFIQADHYLGLITESVAENWVAQEPASVPSVGLSFCLEEQNQKDSWDAGIPRGFYGKMTPTYHLGNFFFSFHVRFLMSF